MSEKVTRKTEARVAERERARVQQQRKSMMKKAIPLTLGAIVVLFLVFVALTTVNQATQGTLGARLQVDREKLDLGAQVFDQPVRAQFHVKNAGDSTLKLTVPRVVNALQGC